MIELFILGALGGLLVGLCIGTLAELRQLKRIIKGEQ